MGNKTDGALTVNPIPISPSELESGELRVTQADFCSAFPYHIIVDRDCKVVQVGKDL